MTGDALSLKDGCDVCVRGKSYEETRKRKIDAIARENVVRGRGQMRK